MFYCRPPAKENQTSGFRGAHFSILGGKAQPNNPRETQAAIKKPTIGGAIFLLNLAPWNPVLCLPFCYRISSHLETKKPLS